MVYCTSLFARGTGLGNRLFPWARSVLFSSVHRVPMLKPMWVRPSIGPIARGGIAPRNYLRQFALFNLFQKREGEISGVLRLKILQSAIRYPEPESLLGSPLPSGEAPSLITMQRDKDHFLPFAQERSLILNEFRKMSHPKWVRLADSLPSYPVALNIRRAKDFPDPQLPRDFHATGPIRTPLWWFIDTLNYIRAVFGYSVPAIVVSDGTRLDLAPVLSLENVSLLEPGCPISDLLVLSKAKLLVGSGGSSFSAWASYFGQSPTVTFPGQSLTWFKLQHTNGAYLGEFDTRTPSSSFEYQVRDLSRSLSRRIVVC